MSNEVHKQNSMINQRDRKLKEDIRKYENGAHIVCIGTRKTAVNNIRITVNNQ